MNLGVSNLIQGEPQKKVSDLESWEMEAGLDQELKMIEAKNRDLTFRSWMEGGLWGVGGILTGVLLVKLFWR